LDREGNARALRLAAIREKRSCAAEVETDLGGPAIGRCALFEGLTVAQRREVAALATQKHFEPAGVLYREGEPAQALHLLVSGRVKVTQARRRGPAAEVRLLGPGELCGWPSVLTNEVYPATTAALESVHAITWNAAVLARLFRSFTVLPLNGLRLMALRLAELQERCDELATEQAPQRLARVLLRLASAGPRFEDELIDLPLSRAELGQQA
jgi:CRP/FNR family transcriptional regulator